MNLCADCGALDPRWASINRGVLVCNDCCSVHRSLGVHISNIRSLSSHHWPPVQREMVSSLVVKGANSLWEHALHDPHSKIKFKKPNPKDKIQPNKHDFITAKYKNLIFLPRFQSKDNVSSLDELSKQLHASVRTSNLETCLRLLSLGANPNYMHPDRGNSPLHVAAQAGQAMQVELLSVNGANPCILDRLGHTPEECARIAGHHQLADRLIECQFELTDSLSVFLCGRKPVHGIGEHFLVPQTVNSGLSEARSRLQELSNELFEELAADVYDEVNRRETDAQWLMTEQLQSSVAFLPVNPTLSPLRNQGRQKLATLNAEEFSQLVADLLLDTKRRQMVSLETGQTSGTVVPSTSEDQTALYDPHDYDEVPTEEARMSIAVPPPPPSSVVPAPSLSSQPPADPTYSEVDQHMKKKLDPIPDYSELKDPPPRQSVAADPEGIRSASVTRVKFDLVKDQLKKVMSEKEKLEVENQQLHKRLEEMQKQLNKVIEENATLRSSIQRSPTPTSPLPPISEMMAGKEEDAVLEVQPSSAHDTYAKVNKNKKSPQSSASSSRTPSTVLERVPSPSSPQQTTPPTNELYSVPMKKNKSSNSDITPAVTPPPGRQDTPLSDSAFEDPHEPSLVIPPVEEVHGHVKKITQCIQELLQAAQTHRQSSFSPCSLKIMKAVETLIKTFPPKPASQIVQGTLRDVSTAAGRLNTDCNDSSQSDVAFRTKHIMNSAYDVAKALRHLVTAVEHEKSTAT